MHRSLPALAAAFSFSIAAQAAAQAAPATATQPAARWHVDGATSRCVLTRRLEGTPAPATFILRTIPGSGRYDVMLAGPDLPQDVRRLRRGARFTLLPAGASFAGTAASIDLPGGLGQGLVLGPLPPLIGAELARASTIGIADANGRELGRWALPAAARAAEALAYCEAEKRVEWGADPAGFEPGSTPPRPIGDASGWITPRELGLVNALSPVEISAAFRLSLNAEGRATDCTVLESAGNVDGRDACGLLVRRARYEPARDPNGNAVRSVAVHVVSMRYETDIRIIEG